MWNEGELRLEPQISLRTAFILQGTTSEAQALNTDGTWKCIQNSSYSPIPVRMRTYYVADPSGRVNLAAQPKGWGTVSFPVKGWKSAQRLFAGNPKNTMGQNVILNGWLLVPSALPQMELTQQRLMQVRQSEGIGLPCLGCQPEHRFFPNIGGKMPHARGKISVNYADVNGKFQADIDLPAKTTGRFIWKGKSYHLKEEKNSIKI